MSTPEVKEMDHESFAAFLDGTPNLLDLSRYSVAGFDFAARTLDMVVAHESRFPNASFDGCDLSGAILNRTEAPNSSWKDASLVKTEVYRAALGRGNFDGANLNRAFFNQVDLRGATFRDASLAGTSFAGCDLTEASFEGAGLEGASFSECMLEGVEWGAREEPPRIRDGSEQTEPVPPCGNG